MFYVNLDMIPESNLTFFKSQPEKPLQVDYTLLQEYYCVYSSCEER